MILWGIDLGGTKIECAVIDFKDNTFEVIARRRVPTEAQQGYEHILGQIKKVIDLVKQETGLNLDSIGIATPGIIDSKTQKMKNSNTQCLNGKYLLEDLHKILEVPVFLANDANCFALAETLLGEISSLLPENSVVFGIIMGTGVGGGMVVNKKIHEGKHGIAGEWGHNVIEEAGDPCYCGKRGCVEKVISGTGLEAYYHKISEKKMSLKDILVARELGIDTFAIQTMERLLTYYGKGIASIINVLDPQAIVIGGGVSNVPFLYTEGREYIKKHLFNDSLETVIVPNSLGDSAGVFGAALLTKK